MLKRLRQEKGISQEQLAHRTGISQSHIVRTEHGETNTSISHASLYAYALDVPIMRLFDFEYDVSAILKHMERSSGLTKTSK